MELRPPWRGRGLVLRRRLRRKPKHSARTCDDEDDLCDTALPAGGGRPPTQQVQNTAAPRSWLDTMVGRKGLRRGTDTTAARASAIAKGLGDNLEELQLELALRVTSEGSRDTHCERRVWDFPAGAKQQQTTTIATIAQCEEPLCELILDDETDSGCDDDDTEEPFEDLVEHGERRAPLAEPVEPRLSTSPTAVRLQC